MLHIRCSGGLACSILFPSRSRQLDRCEFGDAGSRDEGAGAHPQPSPIPMRFAGMPSAGSPALVRPTQFLQHKGARLGRMLSRAISFTPSSGGRAPLGIVGSYRIRPKGSALRLVARLALSSVIPAKAGIHAWHKRWTSALTARFAVAIHPDSVSTRPEAWGTASSLRTRSRKQ